MNDDDRVFKALADPTRRFLLDLLFRRDGRTLTELETQLEMTRFGVAKHLRVLEDAGLVIARRSGREKLHFLNSVPIRLIHDRWIDKYTEPHVTALIELKNLLEGRIMSTDSTQVFRIWIKASPEKIWAAITDPEWNGRYAYAAPSFYELKPGGSFHSTANQGMKDYGAANGFEVPDVIVDGEVIKAEPPRLLVQTWRMLMDPTTAAEPFTTVTYEIEDSKTQPGVCKLTLTHELTGAPATAKMVAGTEDGGAGGGWAWILSDLKTLVETDKALAE